MATSSPVEQPARIRVLIADADPLARRALRDGLSAATDFIVTAETGNGVEAAELTAHYRPELIVLATVLPQLDGVAALKRIVASSPGTRALMLAPTGDDAIGTDAMLAGAGGFVGKELGVEGLIEVLQRIVAGETVISPELTCRLVEHLRATPKHGVGMRPVRSALSPREWEVLDLMTTGKTTAEMADELYLSTETIQSHIKNLSRKLGVHSRREAVERGQQLRRVGGQDRLSVAA